MYKSLLSLVLIALCSLQLKAQSLGSTQYTYDCNAVGAANIGGKEVKYFHLSNYFGKGLVVNFKDHLILKTIESGPTEAEAKSIYSGAISSIPVKGLKLELEGSDITGGTASGNAFLVLGETRVEFMCHIDWSPY